MLTPIVDIAPFIALNLHTAPLNGSKIVREPLKREDGTLNPSAGKKKGFSFQTDWKSHYQATMNTLATPIGVALTGKNNNIVAIDCDCTASYTLFRSLDPTNTAFFDSIGKLNQNKEPIACGTILYQYQDDLPANKSIKGNYDIDWINGVNAIFLPTASNHTKTAWKEDQNNTLYNHLGAEVHILPMPTAVKTLLNLVLEANSPTATTKTVATTKHSQRARGYLAKSLAKINFKTLIEDDRYDPTVTRILTPKSFRSKLYHEQQHLHPNDIDGSGHEYLFKVMAHLAGDNTVDDKLARQVIVYLNSLWDNPIQSKKLEQTILAPILSGRQTNEDNTPYWQYDPHWEELQNWTYIDRREQHLIEVFYDDKRMTHYFYNTETDDLQEIVTKSSVMNHAVATSAEKYNQHDAYYAMANVRTQVDPIENFGYLNNDKDFNLFKPTQALRILHDPTLHKDNYKEPTEFINYMQYFIPNEEVRSYFLSLIRTKLTTFETSAVIPYIVGVQGSGKGILMSLLENIMGLYYVSKDVGGKAFLSDFNKGILENKYFVNLNEMGSGLTYSEAEQAKEYLKNYTGSNTFQCHGKNLERYTADMKAMFIMTANKSPLKVEDNDRRIYYIYTPNKFMNSPQCQVIDPNIVYKNILGQVEDIAYYLSTEISNLVGRDYTDAPSSPDKSACTKSKMELVELIPMLLSEGSYGEIDDIFQADTPLVKKPRHNTKLNTKVIAEAIMTKFSTTKTPPFSDILTKVDRYSKEYKIPWSKAKGAGNGLNLVIETLETYLAGANNEND